MNTARAPHRRRPGWWAGPALAALVGSGVVAGIAIGPSLTDGVDTPPGLQVGALGRASSVAPIGTPPPTTATARPAAEGNGADADGGVEPPDPGEGDNGAPRLVVVTPRRAVVVWSGGKPSSTGDAADDRADSAPTGTPSGSRGAEPSEPGD